MNVVVRRPLALLPALAVLVAAPGCGALDRVARDDAPDRVVTLDEERGTVAGVELGAPVDEMVAALGTPGERGGGPAFPLGENLGRASLNIAMPSGGRELEVLRYSGLAVLVAGGEVFAAVATGRATTVSGVGVGDGLSEARAAFPGLRCAAVPRAEPLIQGLEPDRVQRCRVRLGPRLRLGFVGDPIESVTLSTTGLGI